MQCVLFCVWFHLFRIISSRSFHVVTGIGHFFLFIADNYYFAWIFYSLFIQSLVGNSCFQFGVSINETTVTFMCKSLNERVFSFLLDKLVVGLVRHIAVVHLTFYETVKLFLNGAVPFSTAISSVCKIQFLQILT